MLTGRRPIIYGDGRQTRDYVFVTDIAAANLAAATAGELTRGEYNVGTGTEVINVLELAQAVAAAAGVNPADFEPEFAPARAGELLRSCLDVTRAQRDLNRPAPTPLAVRTGPQPGLGTHGGLALGILGP